MKKQKRTKTDIRQLIRVTGRVLRYMLKNYKFSFSW